METVMYTVPLQELLVHFRTIVREEIQLHTSFSENKTDEFLTIKKVCALFTPQVTPATIHNWCKGGKLIKHRIGGRVFFKKDEVLKSIQSLQKYKRG
jgi:hypothetical protein